jgi:tetratricopeptide (TPR) repeat protein
MTIHERLDDMTQQHGPAPAAALRRLALCRGGFTGEAARAILELDDVQKLEAILTVLQEWGMIERADARYRLAPQVRAALDPDDSARQAHYTYYERLARRCRDQQDYAALQPEFDNLAAAFEGALVASDGEMAYWLYNAASDFLIVQGRHDLNIEWLRRAGEVLTPEAGDYLWGAVQNSLGVAYQNIPGGDRRANLRRAIQAYQEALAFHNFENTPQAFAVAQSNLGSAYADLAHLEERAENLRRAVDAYHASLAFRTPEDDPLAYAATQHNLGNASRELAGIENRVENLERALVAYWAALKYYTPESAPLDHAATQNNLGNVYRDLAGVKPRKELAYLQQAIDAYQAALRFRTPDAFPQAYATTQNNLGTAYRALSELQDRRENLALAIQAYHEALRFHTPDSAPLSYAAAQNNLGMAYHSLAKVEDRVDNLKRAMQAYAEALQHYTPDDSPIEYAKTRANLGLAYEDIGDVEAAVECWVAAQRYFQQMGAADQAELMQQWIDGAQR